MILVTGATGFLGSELAALLLKQGAEIRCTKRKSSVIPVILVPFQKKIEWVEADLLDIFALENAIKDVKQVYHCAAWVSLKQADKKQMIYANLTGTANLVNLCLLYGVRLLHVSSIAALGEAKPGEMINETHHLDETMVSDGYAISKFESEMEVWRGIAEGLNAVIVNPSLIIGASAGTNGSGQLFETVRKGLKFYTSGSSGLVDVHDVAACMISLMNGNIHSERFIISAENREFKQLIPEIAAGFGIIPPGIYAKPWMLSIGWRVASLLSAFTGKPPFLDKMSALSASSTSNYDNSKIKKAITIEFKPISDSIKEICARLQIKSPL
jgi:dihydroflavonol-4-reductase